MAKLTLRDLVGTIKDKASQSKAAIMSKPHALVSLLRATTHDSRAPPDPKHIAAVLALGQSSRAAASVAIEALMDRLSHTRDAYVALKCLIAAHHVAISGGFILRDQLSIFPAAGGRNYLNVSRFRDESSHVTWDLSTWVRWYGQYVECLVSVSRDLGYFLAENILDPSSVTAVTNSELVRETESLVSLVEQFCKQPEVLVVDGNKLVDAIRVLVGHDGLSAMNEISVRVDEFKARVSCLSLTESVELVCALKRLEECRERLAVLLSYKETCYNELGFWGLVGEIKERVGKERDERLMAVKKLRVKEIGTVSARFGERVLRPGESFKFGSGRLSVSVF